VLGAHAGALIYLLAVHEPDIVGSNMDVVTVELAPIDSTPDAVERDLAPAPETMVESSPLRDLPKPQEKPFGRDGRCRRANLSIKRNEPHSGAGLLGLIPTRTKQLWSGARLSYRIMVDAGLTSAGLDHCRSRVHSRLWLAQQLRQLGDIGGDAPRLVTGEQLARRPATGLILAIDKCQRLPVGVAHNEARGGFLDCQRRGEVAS
jgi:hypothetical protein